MQTCVTSPFHLTGREYSMLRGLLEGKSNKVMAFDLGLSPNTVKVYFTRLSDKLNIRGRLQLVIWAYAHPDDVNLWPSNPK
jgi:two-component system, LuxR family, response regulator FixJ